MIKYLLFPAMKDELDQGCQTHFHWGPHQPRSCFKGPNIILGLYKCNYFLTVKQELGTAAEQKQGAEPDKTNKVEGWILLSGLVFATCELDNPCFHIVHSLEV